jgi:hypothetical protein
MDVTWAVISIIFVITLLSLLGLFLEGAKYNSVTNLLEDVQVPELYYKMPTILVKASNNPIITSSPNSYSCPIYTSSLRGDANFVANMMIPTNLPESHWYVVL